MKLEKNKIENRFYKKKEFILNLLIEYYGKEYEEQIRKKIEAVNFIFSSLPKYDYEFMKENPQEFSSYEKAVITLEYKKEQLLEKIFTEEARKELLNDIESILETSIEEGKEEFLEIFTKDDFSKSIIDSYSTKTSSLEDAQLLPKNVLEEIQKNQIECKEKLQSYHIDIDKIDSNLIDEIIQHRRDKRQEIRASLVNHLSFTREIKEYYKRKANRSFSNKTIATIAYVFHGYAGAIIVGGIEEYPYVRVPITYLLSIGIKGIDVCIIHEIIHQVETNKRITGIRSEMKTELGIEDIMNEIRTQLLAINLTKKLHQNNIFLYDNPNDYRIEGESYYEQFLPYTRDFFEKHEKFLADCAINNDRERLLEQFGEPFKEFQYLLDNLYESSVKYGLESIEEEQKQEVREKIKEIEKYQEKRKQFLKK